MGVQAFILALPKGCGDILRYKLKLIYIINDYYSLQRTIFIKA
jgi:hypothetical protein